MVYRNNAGRLFSGFISVCLETRWLCHWHLGGFYVPERPSTRNHLGTWNSAMVRSPKRSRFVLTLNLMIMSIVGRLYWFKVITRTFLHFRTSSNSVCIWFEQSIFFSKVWTWQHDKTQGQNTSLILVRLFLSRSVHLSCLGQSPSLEAQSQSLRLRPGYSHTVWDSESRILWWLSSSVLKLRDTKCHARLCIIMPRSAMAKRGAHAAQERWICLLG